MGRTWCRTDPIGFIGHFLDTSNVPSICPKETYVPKSWCWENYFPTCSFRLDFWWFLGAAFLDKSKGVRLKMASNRATPNPIIPMVSHTQIRSFSANKKTCVPRSFWAQSLEYPNSGARPRVKVEVLSFKDTSGHVLNYPPNKKNYIIYNITVYNYVYIQGMAQSMGQLRYTRNISSVPTNGTIE